MDEAPRPQFGFIHEWLLIPDASSFLVWSILLAIAGILLAFPVKRLGLHLSARYPKIDPVLVACILAAASSILFYLGFCLVLRLELFEETAVMLVVVASIGTPVFLIVLHAVRRLRDPNPYGKIV